MPRCCSDLLDAKALLPERWDVSDLMDLAKEIQLNRLEISFFEAGIDMELKLAWMSDCHDSTLGHSRTSSKRHFLPSRACL